MSARGVCFGAAFAVSIVAAVPGAGCANVFGIDQLSPVSDGGPGQPCDPYSSPETPCAAGYVCLSSVCSKTCNADSQCQPGERCTAANGGGSGANGGNVYGCVAVQGEPCQYTGPNNGGCFNGMCPCPGGAQCGPDGQCRLSCTTGGTPACLSDQTCVGLTTACGGPNGSGCNGVCYGSPPHDGPPDAGHGEAGVVTLQSNQNNPQGIAVSGTTLLWTTQTLVMSCTLPACTNAAPAPGPQAATSIVIANGNAFWIDQSTATLRGCGLPTCSSVQTIATVPAGGPGGAALLATEGASVFFAGGNDVLFCPGMLAPCSNPQRVFPQMNSVFGIAVEGSASAVFVSRPGHVASCPLTGCTMETTIIPNLGTPGALAVDTGDGLLFAATSQADIMSCPVAGCPSANTAIQGQNQVATMVADGPNLYWTAAGSGTVMHCTTTSCAATVSTIASGQNQPWGLAVDGQYVYFTVKGENAIKRAPR